MKQTRRAVARLPAHDRPDPDLRGLGGDREDEHEGREPDDSGIANNDGLQEQVGRQDRRSGVFG